MAFLTDTRHEATMKGNMKIRGVQYMKRCLKCVSNFLGYMLETGGIYLYPVMIFFRRNVGYVSREVENVLCIESGYVSGMVLN